MINASPVPTADTATPAANPQPQAANTVAAAGASLALTAARSPLPGETASTPMADLVANRERDVPPQLVEGEREFAAEPVDATWAPGAEADLLAKFAQMPGLTLIGLEVECRSTMCRLQLLQPRGGPPVDGSPRQFNILVDSLGLEPRWMMAIQDRAGPMRSVAYLWRDGFAPRREPGQPHETN